RFVCSRLHRRIEGGCSAAAVPCSSKPIRVCAVLPSCSGSGVFLLGAAVAHFFKMVWALLRVWLSILE
ncbi:hypothetical protein A2U01_0090327, partial [Trifolium medium]|nr:hypothetical protein [Trifolium medium]